MLISFSDQYLRKMVVNKLQVLNQRINYWILVSAITPKHLNQSKAWNMIFRWFLIKAVKRCSSHLVQGQQTLQLPTSLILENCLSYSRKSSKTDKISRIKEYFEYENRTEECFLIEVFITSIFTIETTKKVFNQSFLNNSLRHWLMFISYIFCTYLWLYL